MKTNRILNPRFLSLVAALAVLLSGCAVQLPFGKAGLAKETRPLSGVTGLKVKLACDVVVKIGHEEMVTIETHEDMLSHIQTEIINGQLEISFTNHGERLKMHLTNPIRITVFLKQLDTVETTTRVNVNIHDYQGESLVLSTLSSGSIIATGTVQTLNVTSSSSGTINCRNLRANDVFANAKSNGIITVWTVDRLSATTASKGDIYYFGNPSELIRNEMSTGRIVHRFGR